MPFLIALALAVVLTPAAGRLARAAGLVDEPGNPLKLHHVAVPVLGGLAAVASAFAALAIDGTLPAAAVAVAAAVALAGGALDDRRGLPTQAHLALQAAVAAIVAGWAFELGLGGEAAVFAGVVVCMNAVNLVDGQDGLAGGLGAIAALGLATLLPAHDAAFALALAGGLGGFLVWNRPPARIFLGNGGAYAVGALLAVLGAMAVVDGGAREVPAVLLCLGVFLFDFAFTLARRLGSGRLAAGDRLHSYDLLSTEAGGRGRATLALCGAGALLAAAAPLAASLPVAAGVALATIPAAAAAAWGRGLWRSHRPDQPAERTAPGELPSVLAVSRSPSSSATRGS